MVLQIISILVIASIIGFFINFAFIDGVLQAPFADAFIAFCENVLQLDYYAASNAYHVLFRQNKSLWLAIGFILLLLIIFYIALSRFTRYFHQISSSITMLADESGKEIELPAELDFWKKIK